MDGRDDGAAVLRRDREVKAPEALDFGLGVPPASLISICTICSAYSSSACTVSNSVRRGISFDIRLDAPVICESSDEVTLARDAGELLSQWRHL